MKASRYNYIFYEEDMSYWYNGLSKKYFRLNSKLGHKVESLLKKNKIDCLPIIIKSKLADAGFILTKEDDELDKIKELNRISTQNKDYFLIILPTLNCNFSCWYCIQNHIPSIMSETTVSRIKDHLEYMVKKEEITSLHIEWFGGEPFMGYKNIILPLSRFAKNLCDTYNLPFYNTATTNGFFLTQEKYQSMKEIEMNGFQITLDGDRDMHNHVKISSNGESAFDKTLGNIKGYLEYNNNATLKLRINYTHQNLTKKVIEQIKDLFPTQLRKRVQINLKKVWQEEVDKNYYNKTINVQKNFSKLGFQVQKLDIVTNYIPCYVCRKYYTAINYDGNLIKCTASNDLYSKQPLGNINPDGSLHWTEGVEEKFMTLSFENKKCLECKYLPLCMGVCPRNYDKRHHRCKMDSFDINIDKGILNYVKEAYHETCD